DRCSPGEARPTAFSPADSRRSCHLTDSVPSLLRLRLSCNLSLSRSGQGPERLYPTGHESNGRKVAMVFFSQVVRGLRMLIVAGQYLFRAPSCYPINPM